MIHSWAFVFLLSSFSLEGGCHQTSQLLLKRELYCFFVIFAGMKHLLWIIVAMMVLGAVVPGCDDVPRYDGRLTAADSLIHDHADSALTMLEALTPSDLATEGDRAYHDLLLTQARYKCYRPATTDSTINRALAYYRAHPNEREKLTRAYIYKGTVMEELGHPDSAMFYYKQAEATSTPDDYANLGQINIRIASIYRINYVDAQTCYNKYKRAMEYYNLLGDDHKIVLCLYNMGVCSGITGDRDPKQLLDSAATMALELNDSSLYIDCMEMIVRQLIKKDSAFSEAKQIAFHLLNDFKCNQNSNLLLNIADIYIKERKSDSAKFYVNQVSLQDQESQDIQIKLREYNSLANIASLNGNMATYNEFLEDCKRLSDSISNNNLKYRLRLIEKNKNDEQVKSIIKQEKNKYNWIFWALILIALLPMSSFIIYQYRKILNVKSILCDLRNTSINTHEALLNQLHAKEESVERLVQNMVCFMQSSIDTVEKDPPSVIRKRIKETITDVADENFWAELRAYLDNNYNNIISNIAENPKINDTDIRFIELVCCGFSYIEMAITLGYSINYISNKRLKIKKKLHINISLEEYLKQAMNK